MNSSPVTSFLAKAPNGKFKVEKYYDGVENELCIDPKADATPSTAAPSSSHLPPCSSKALPPRSTTRTSAATPAPCPVVNVNPPVQDKSEATASAIMLKKPKILLGIDQLVLKNLEYTVENMKSQISSLTEDFKVYQTLSDLIVARELEILALEALLQTLNSSALIKIGELRWDISPSFGVTIPTVCTKSIVVDHDIEHIIKTLSVEHDNDWRDEAQSTRYYSVGLSGRMLSGWHGDVKLFTTARKYNVLKIESLKASIAEHLCCLKKMKDDLEIMRSQQGGKKEEQVELEMRMEIYTTAIDILHADYMQPAFFTSHANLYSEIAIALTANGDDDKRDTLTSNLCSLEKAYCNLAEKRLKGPSKRIFDACRQDYITKFIIDYFSPLVKN
ncbi:hypothetical protein BDR26DRAFT_866930 [Obelidium mucronatum]|nr:hypothetical protein BDR26DRAFT_866930 [Obelidium mucronatum]